MAFVKWMFLCLLILVVSRWHYWKKEAGWYKNQWKDREYIVERLHFKLENMESHPGSLCFFGDSLTLLWPTRQYFPGSYNRGISSETTATMLRRFKEDVLYLHPATVIILGGTNDIAQGLDYRMAFANIDRMARMAREAGIKVFVCTLPPINGKHEIHLNGLIRHSQSPIIELDYYMGHPNFFADRAHPNLAGYEAMSKLVKDALEKN